MEFLQAHKEPLTLVRGARECYHLPKVNSQTSGGKEASYFSILDWLQAKSNRFPKENIPTLYILKCLWSNTRKPGPVDICHWSNQLFSKVSLDVI